MSNTNNNLQTQTSNALHNAIIEAGGKDRPLMLAPGNYVQWKSQIKRYIDTKPNNELIYYCLQNPPYKFKWAERTIPVAEGSSEITTEGYMENYKHVLQDIRNQLDAEAESVQIILTGIDNDIYSTVDACLNACEMWKSIERLKQGESINVQDLETNLYYEYGKFTSMDGETLKSYYSRPQQAATRNRGKAIVNSPQPNYDQEPAMVAEDDEMSKENGIDKLMALISLSFKKIYKPTNNNLRTSSNTNRANQDNTLRINRGTGECQKPKRAKDAAYHKEKMLLCKQGEAIQEVTPDTADNSGPIFDDEPLQKVQNNDDNYNVFANDREHPEQPESINDTYSNEQGDTNINTVSLDMSNNGGEADQDNDDDDLARERDLLASLIEKLKCKIDENKYRNKLLESSNKTLVDKLKSEIEDFKNKNKCLESSNNHFKEANTELAKNNQLMFKDFKKFQAELDRNEKGAYCTSRIHLYNVTKKEAQTKFYKTREDKEIEKVIALENKVKVLDDIVYKTSQSLQIMNMLNHNCKTSFVKPEFLKKAQRANPRLYDIGCYNVNLAFMLAPESDETIRLAQESRSKLSDLIRHFDYKNLNNLYDLFVPQREKSPEQRYFSESSADTIFDGVKRCKQTIAKRTYFGHIDPFIQNTIEGNFSPQIHAILADLEKFYLCLKEEMVADLRYFNSLEMKEYYYADHMNAIPGVYTKLDEFTDLQCDYLDQVVKCERVEKGLSKRTENVNNKSFNELSKRFSELEQHSINLELALQQNSLAKKDFSKSKSVTINNVSSDLSNPVTTQILPQNVNTIPKNTNVIAPGMYKVHTMPNQTRTTQLPQDITKTNKRVSFSTGVLPTTSVSRPQLKSNRLKDRVLHNNSQGKKQQVEDHHRNFMFSNNKTSVTACNDSLNAKTLNVNFISVTCGKCVLNDNHDMCVLHYINGVNSRTKQPIVVPISTREPKRNVNQSVATPLKKTLVEIILVIVDSGCSKHMMGNLKLLSNFVEKFLGTVKFGNDQIAPILGYGDLVQEVAFRKSTCYIRDLKGNDLLTACYARRLSHLNFDSINLLLKYDIVTDLPKLKFIKDHLSSSCELEKAKRLHAQVRTVRTDKGTKFLNKTLHAYFSQEGIEHQTSTARTPEQNGVIERRNHTLVEAARTMLSSAKVPLHFWAEEIATTCFTQNRSLVIPRHGKNIINGQKQSVKFFYIFGSLCYIVRDGENLDKMKEKGHSCICVGYSTQSRAQENVPQAAETVTTSNELDLLFSPIFDELLNETTQVVSKYSVVTTDDVPNQRQQQHTNPSDSITVAADTPLLNIQTTLETTSQAPTQAPTSKTSARNRWRDVYVRITWKVERTKNIKEAMADSAWIKAMQEELH
ncbi:retrovirus-related pol polyprotein from transposon TNT 1-94 [Tanacetum coccineum]